MSAASCRKDLTAFSTRVGTEDKAKIQAHLQAIRDLEAQLAAGARGKSCSAPMVGSSRTLDTPTRSSIMFTLIGAALRCDLTRVVSLTFYDDHGKFNIRFPWLDGVTDDYHPLAHLGEKGYPTKLKIDTWLFSQVAALWTSQSPALARLAMTARSMRSCRAKRVPAPCAP